MNQYSTVDIERILGIKRKRLIEWIDGVFVKPSISEASGIGTRNLFSRWDLYGIEIFRRLLDTGVPRLDAMNVFSFWSETTKKFDISRRSEISKHVVFHSYADMRLGEKGEKEARAHISSQEIIMKNEDKLAISDLEKREPNRTFVRTEIIDIQEVIKFVDKKLE